MATNIDQIQVQSFLNPLVTIVAVLMAYQQNVLLKLHQGIIVLSVRIAIMTMNMKAYKYTRGQTDYCGLET